MFELLGLQSLTELEKASLMFALGGLVVTTMFYLEYKWKQSRRTSKELRKTDRNAKQKLHLQKVRAELAELKHLRDWSTHIWITVDRTLKSQIECCCVTIIGARVQQRHFIRELILPYETCDQSVCTNRTWYLFLQYESAEHTFRGLEMRVECIIVDYFTKQNETPNRSSISPKSTSRACRAYLHLRGRTGSRTLLHGRRRTLRPYAEEHSSVAVDSARSACHLRRRAGMGSCVVRFWGDIWVVCCWLIWDILILQQIFLFSNMTCTFEGTLLVVPGTTLYTL